MPKPHSILIGDDWCQETHTDSFAATNPTTGNAMDATYPISTRETLAKLARNGALAARLLNHCDPEQIASFLDVHAHEIDTRRQEIAEIAHAETGLARTPRLLHVEMDRTIDQLRQTAACVRDGEWTMPLIDTELDLRSMYEPLAGAVLTIGPNNFPLAYNAIAGGDFASAIAARNPVIAKAHPLHPGTSRLLAQCAHTASQHAQLPSGSIQMFYHCEPDDGLALVRMHEISAVGFTGSRSAGLALKKAADETGTPIYLELSSINPIFVLPHAAQDRSESIAKIIADSMLAASGQQCTSPGLIITPASSATLIDSLTAQLTQAEPQVMLSPSGVEGLHHSIQSNLDSNATLLCGGSPIDGPSAMHQHTLLHADAETFLANSNRLQTEMFGVAALIITYEHDQQMLGIANALEGNLTGTVHHEPEDHRLLDQLSILLRPRVGRLVHNAVPTGVSVNAATVHGGPFPATGHPGFTAVGMPTSIHRFAARRCYDRVAHHTLPPELQDSIA
jgi:alpha-ketoglutaric semialdehyde dehydrogenase